MIRVCLGCVPRMRRRIGTQQTIAKLQGVTAIWQGNYIAADIAGGLVCTLPAADDCQHERICTLLDKYLKGKADVQTGNRIRMMGLVEYLTGQGSVIPIESTRGGRLPPRPSASLSSKSCCGSSNGSSRMQRSWRASRRNESGRRCP